MTRHCHGCGKVWTAAIAPGRRDTCESCGRDLRCCLNCLQHDARAAEQCRERRAELVQEKDRANYCEYFDFVRREYRAQAHPASAREEAARDTMRRLLGD